jgi:hypothetical protein
MKNILLILTALALLGLCQTLDAGPSAKPDIATRDNCYGLLHQLLDEQKDVSLLHLIKHEYPDFEDLMRRIARMSGTGAKLLEQLAKKDSSLRLDDIELPPGEVATRDAIAKTTEKKLLGEKGERFHLNLLLSQLEALNYGSHLADVACENDTDTEREQALTDLSKDMRGLYDEAFEKLLSRTQLKTAGDK